MVTVIDSYVHEKLLPITRRIQFIECFLILEISFDAKCLFPPSDVEGKPPSCQIYFIENILPRKVRNPKYRIVQVLCRQFIVGTLLYPYLLGRRVKGSDRSIYL